MEKIKLFDHRMVDGSRNFADLPEVAGFGAMREHLKSLKGATEVDYITDQVTEVWIDFERNGYRFSINNQSGWYWLFADDPETPEAELEAVAEHFAQINPE